jgi:hypothetical protein
MGQINVLTLNYERKQIKLSFLAKNIVEYFTDCGN